MEILSVQVAVATLILLGVSLLLQRWVYGISRERLRAAQFTSLATLVILALSWAVPRTLTWIYSFRSQPAPLRATWFEGVEYFREAQMSPRPMVIHVVKIDLAAPGIGFLVTPPSESGGRQLRGVTTSQFLSGYHLQAAINGDFFEPWSDNTPLDYYPHAGDPVDVLGFAASLGTVYSRGRANHPTLYLSHDNQASFDAPSGPIYNAISGGMIIVKEGKPYQVDLAEPYLREAHPRTAVALDATGRTLLLIVVDGRQPGYSDGATLSDLAQIAIRYGASEALNLDGGGSTTLAMEGADGRPRVVNSPIHNHIPTMERPVANHLGVFALPTK